MRAKTLFKAKCFKFFDVFLAGLVYFVILTTVENEI